MLLIHIVLLYDIQTAKIHTYAGRDSVMNSTKVLKKILKHLWVHFPPKETSSLPPKKTPQTSYKVALFSARPRYDSSLSISSLPRNLSSGEHLQKFKVEIWRKYKKLPFLLLMEIIRRSPVELGSLSQYLQGFSTIPGGCLGFLKHQQYGENNMKLPFLP